MPDLLPAPTCTDGVKNGAETDIDCGGGACPPCLAGKGCMLGTDCLSTLCLNGTCFCGALTNCSGLCIDTGSDTNNCGACGKVCPKEPNGAPTCSGGMCGIACAAPFANCNGLLADGCEVDLSSSASNCGGCGKVCNLANATAACSASACVIASCNPGFADCNGLAADGCEVDTRSNASNCGSCGKVCSLPNATAACSASTCVVATCNAGFANCDGLNPNGCEIDTRTSATNCGSCGKVCNLPHATSACSASTCVVTGCTGGFGNCNGLNPDGCEAPLGTDVNCAACGNNCGGAGIGYCYSSSCVPWPNVSYTGNSGGGCADIGPDNSVNGRYLLFLGVSGRPNAPFTRYCHHLSCGGSMVFPCGLYPGEGVLDGFGNYSYTDNGGQQCTIDPGCTNGVAGQWESMVVIDGRSSAWVDFTFFDSCCPSYSTCQQAASFCPACFPASCQ